MDKHNHEEALHYANLALSVLVNRPKEIQEEMLELAIRRIERVIAILSGLPEV
jgi:hypothetical protein